MVVHTSTNFIHKWSTPGFNILLLFILNISVNSSVCFEYADHTMTHDYYDDYDDDISSAPHPADLKPSQPHVMLYIIIIILCVIGAAALAAVGVVVLRCHALRRIRYTTPNIRLTHLDEVIVHCLILICDSLASLCHASCFKTIYITVKTFWLIVKFHYAIYKLKCHVHRSKGSWIFSKTNHHRTNKGIKNFRTSSVESGHRYLQASQGVHCPRGLYRPICDYLQYLLVGIYIM